MVNFSLSPDDRPPQQLGLEDHVLRRRLDESLAQRFFQHCDPTNQKLLSTCEWSITTTANVATLVVVCPNQRTNWQILNQAITLGNRLAELSQDAKLSIYATPDMLDRVEIRVDELSVYQE